MQKHVFKGAECAHCHGRPSPLSHSLPLRKKSVSNLQSRKRRVRIGALNAPFSGCNVRDDMERYDSVGLGDQVVAHLTGDQMILISIPAPSIIFFHPTLTTHPPPSPRITVLEKISDSCNGQKNNASPSEGDVHPKAGRRLTRRANAVALSERVSSVRAYSTDRRNYTGFYRSI